MSMDLTGITNKNEYYTNHYFATVFEENAGETISAWNTAARESEEIRTPWSMLRRNASQFYAAHDRYTRSSLSMQSLYYIKELADSYLHALGYPEKAPLTVSIDDTLSVPVYLEMKKQNGAPLLWVILMASVETDAGIMESYPFEGSELDESSYGQVYKGILGTIAGEELSTKILFGQQEPPRFLILIGMNQIALIDRNKWNEKRYLQFELEEIFSRLENTTLQAMSVLLHRDSLCPDDGKILLDELDEQSQRNASGVSQDLKYALRESIELLGNEVLYDMRTRQRRDLEVDPVDAGQLTIECLRYMYRMLFVLFIEARPELGYAPIKAHSYYTGYSLESLRDIADNIRDDITEVGNGYYLHETLAKLYDLIYNGYPKTEEELKKATGADSLHDMFLVAPLKAHIFDPEYTKMITAAKLRNSCMLRIIELMSLTRSTGKRNSRRGRISYANLGINQMGAVYEALLSYRGFIAEHDLYEVKRANDSFNELDVGYFVSESELDQYAEDERVRYDTGEKKGKLRMYEKGTFIYRLAGREREKSASYYTPEVLTKCLVKYALKELLEGKSADEILELTVCEPAMGSAAFLNETINQLAEAYITRKEQETGNVIGYEDRFNELQKVKMYIADRNVYGIDLNSVAVELAEVSLWLNTIYEGGFVPWFGTQLVNGNSLIGARRQVYSETSLQTSSKGLRWFENAPERVPLGTARKKRRGNTQIYHFLLGDPGMCSYSDKVIKKLEPDNIKTMKNWNKKFTTPYTESELETLRQLSSTIDDLWEDQIKLRQTVEAETQDALSVFGHEDTIEDSHTTIRQKDLIFSKLYKSEHMKNAGPYARLKFAMDYWCALWFWPIDKADLLPSRSEFFSDLNWILVGTISTGKGQASIGYDQLSIFDDDNEELQLIHKINEIQGGSKTQVDLDSLCILFPRLALVKQISEQNHFMHWELEFADLFSEKGGFDLVIGNPPWIKVEWNEQGVLSDKNPIFAIKNLSATQTIQLRNKALDIASVREVFFSEYEKVSGEQAFLNAYQNYPLLKGQQTNLFRCFIPMAWTFGNRKGVSSFIHPDGVYDDPKGGALRMVLYPKLRKHFQFTNELKMFEGIDHHTSFSLNIYSNIETTTYLQRTNYKPGCSIKEYQLRVPMTPWGTKCYDTYRVIMRNMFNQSGERTLISCLSPLMTGHVHAVFEIQTNNQSETVLLSGYMASICYDFYVKATGKGSGGIGVVSSFPIMKTDQSKSIILRTLLLNCLSSYYSPLWNECFEESFTAEEWSKQDVRLRKDKYTELKKEWVWETPIRSDYERRQALVELDVLTAQALGMSLEQLKTIYRIQFPVLQSYEADTWYDISGRIVFTNNRSLVGVGYSRTEWENGIKGASTGSKFYRTLIDDTLPGGPVERTIEYVAPFDRCDREKDYDTAWKFFEEKFGMKD